MGGIIHIVVCKYGSCCLERRALESGMCVRNRGRREAESIALVQETSWFSPLCVGWGIAVLSLLCPPPHKVTRSHGEAGQKEVPQQHKEKHFLANLFSIKSFV